MKLDEDTLEMERPRSNVVHVNFGRRPKGAAHLPSWQTPAPAVPTPWVLRLIAVVMILILSMLIL